MMRKVPDAAWVALAFLVSRAVLFACGLRMRFDLDWTALADPKYLRDDLLHTVWLFHACPPGWSVLTGVLLKLAPAHTAALAHVVFIGLGVTLVLSMFSLARTIGLSRGAAALLCLGFSLAPPTLYFENLYHYEFIVTALLAASAVLFHRALVRGTVGAWAGFFSLCAVLGFFRSLMHLAWFVVMFTLAIAFARASWRRIALGAAGPLLVLLALSSKNLVLFGVFDVATQGPANLALSTTYRLPAETRLEWEREGKLSPFSKTSYASPRELLPLVPPSPPWNEPVLDELEKPTFGSLNYNHRVYLRVNALRRHDIAVYLSERPGEFLQTFLTRGLPTTFSPTTRWHPRTGTPAGPHFEHHALLGGWEDAWNGVVHGLLLAPVGFYAALPVVLVWAAWRAWRRWRSGEAQQRAVAATWAFAVVQVVLLGLLASLAALGENARYRFVFEPFIWLLFAGALAHLTTWLRARREAQANRTPRA